ncbi:MAG: ATP-dependent Clp protease proteolytic subunit [Deltaproteobacteria bacterium]|nr:ATP-dependent Clp protease proteolytic subunit [Deltaproteobacteria bacterium]MCB9788759.1 ATP-dependent Clp protease proteolytic subunit [Deltaproteobacteria bacterium]
MPTASPTGASAHAARRSTRAFGLIALVGAALAMLTSPAAFARSKAKAPPASTIELTSRLVRLDGGISDNLIQKAQKAVLEYNDQSHEPIWLVINSGGGSVEAGLVLIDTMRGLDSPVYCLVESKAYSMAAIILSFCDKRYALDHATIMLHEASYGTAGEDPTNRSRLDFLARYLDGLHVEIAKRLNMAPEKYRARIRDAWWLLASEAAKAGVVDAVATSLDYTELPVESTEEKTTTVLQETTHAVTALPPGQQIPKRRD